jgi:peptide-methionine (R)-S-oxide reductase
MLRRSFLLGGVAGAVTWSGAAGFAALASPSEMFSVTHTDAEWHTLLTPEQYTVLRQSATERPFTSSLLNEHRAGVFVCAGCSRSLFSSETKFDSGTGWPSFWAPLNESAVGTARDTSLGMIRTSVHCAACGGHLGHVFNDGPPVTGLRYCMNGVAMTFKPASA